MVNGPGQEDSLELSPSSGLPLAPVFEHSILPCSPLVAPPLISTTPHVAVLTPQLSAMEPKKQVHPSASRFQQFATEIEQDRPTAVEAVQPLSFSSLRAGLHLSVTHANGKRTVMSGSDLLELKGGVCPYRFPGELDTDDTCLIDLPKILTKRTTLFMMSDLGDQLLPPTQPLLTGNLGTGVYARLCILWPSAMDRTPAWLKRHFKLVNPGQDVCRVQWSMTLFTQLSVWLGKKNDVVSNQNLHVYQSTKVFRPGQAFTIFGTGASGELTDRPYIFAVQLAASEAELAGVGLTMLTATTKELSRAFTSRALTSRALTSSLGADSPMHKGAMNRLGSIHEQASMRIMSSDATAPGLFAAIVGDVGNMLLGQTAASLDAAVLDVLGDNQKLDWDDLPKVLLKQGNLEQIRTFVWSGGLMVPLQSEAWYQRFEYLAVERKDLELLLILHVKYKKHELSRSALGFLINSMWSTARTSSALYYFINTTARGTDESIQLQPGALTASRLGVTLADELQVFLIRYVCEKRNPLSCTAAILRGIDIEMAGWPESHVYLMVVRDRFKSLHLAMLKQMGRFRAAAQVLPVLNLILDPPRFMGRQTINNTSALAYAFESHDLDFMGTPLLATHTQDKWLGRAYLSVTTCKDIRSSSLLSPLQGWKFLKDLGFAGGVADGMIRHSMHMWHLHCLTSRVFFDSPRGRWAMHALSEGVFLTLYQLAISYRRHARLGPICIVLLIFGVGNLVDIGQHVASKYGSPFKLRGWATDPFNTLNLLTNLSLCAIVTAIILRVFKVPSTIFIATASEDDVYNAALAATSDDVLQIILCSLAFAIWARAVGMLVPVYPSLGPLLTTIANMLGELVAFLVPLLAVMFGFVTMLNGVFNETTESYSNWWESNLTLFNSLLGNQDFTAFIEDNQGNPFPMYKRLWGTIVLVLFLVLSTILMLNLLIAVITYRYQPERMAAESLFKRAQIVEFYYMQVKHNQICSPYSILYHSLWWVPSPRRDKISRGSSRRWLLLPLDGVDVPHQHHDEPLLGGRAELPHFFFLVTLYPMIAAWSILLFFAYTPFAAYRFGSKTFKRISMAYSHRKVHPDNGTFRPMTTMGGASRPHSEAGPVLESKGTAQEGDAVSLIALANINQTNAMPASALQTAIPVAHGRATHTTGHQTGPNRIQPITVVASSTPAARCAVYEEATLEQLSPDNSRGVKGTALHLLLNPTDNGHMHRLSASPPTRRSPTQQFLARPGSSSTSPQRLGCLPASPLIGVLGARPVAEDRDIPWIHLPGSAQAVGESNQDGVQGEGHGQAAQALHVVRPGPVAETPHDQGVAQDPQEGTARESGVAPASTVRERSISFALAALSPKKDRALKDSGSNSTMFGEMTQAMEELEGKVKARLTLLAQLLQFIGLFIFVPFGIVLYVVVAGVMVVTLWSTLYTWLAKLLFSVLNMVWVPILSLMGRPTYTGQGVQMSTPVAFHLAPGNRSSKHLGQPTAAAAKNPRAILRWKSAYAQVLKTIPRRQTLQYLGAQELVAALEGSKFSRLLPKWGLDAVSLVQLKTAAAESGSNAANEKQTVQIEKADEDDEPEALEEVLAAIGELKEQSQDVQQRLEELQNKLTAFWAQQHYITCADRQSP